MDIDFSASTDRHSIARPLVRMLGTPNWRAFQRGIEAQLHSGRDLIIDLSQIDEIDIRGVSALRAIRSLADKRGSSLALAGVAPRVRLILEMTRAHLRLVSLDRADLDADMRVAA